MFIDYSFSRTHRFFPLMHTYLSLFIYHARTCTHSRSAVFVYVHTYTHACAHTYLTSARAITMTGTGTARTGKATGVGRTVMGPYTGSRRGSGSTSSTSADPD